METVVQILGEQFFILAQLTIGLMMIMAAVWIVSLPFTLAKRLILRRWPQTEGWAYRSGERTGLLIARVIRR